MALTNSKPNLSAEAVDLIAELRRLSSAGIRGPFPCDDCRNIVAKAGPEFSDLVVDLIADLTNYFHDIWSLGVSAKVLYKEDDLFLQQLREYRRKSFFERHIVYAPLEKMISLEATPDLYEHLVLFDKMRENLILLITCLLDERANSEAPLER